MRASRIDRANLLPASNRSAIAGEVLDDMHHARCQPVCHGERARQLGTQGPPALADGDATLEVCPLPRMRRLTLDVASTLDFLG